MYGNNENRDPLDGYEFLMLGEEAKMSPTMCYGNDPYGKECVASTNTLPKPQFLSTRSTPCRNEYMDIRMCDEFYLPKHKALYYPSFLEANRGDIWSDDQLEVCMSDFSILLAREEMERENKEKEKNEKIHHSKANKNLKRKESRDVLKIRTQKRHSMQLCATTNELPDCDKKNDKKLEDIIEINDSLDDQLKPKSFRIRNISYNNLHVMKKHCIFVLYEYSNRSFPYLKSFNNYFENYYYEGNSYIMGDDMERTYFRDVDKRFKVRKKHLIFISKEIIFPLHIDMYDMYIFTLNRSFNWSDVFSDMKMTPMPLYELVQHRFPYEKDDLLLPESRLANEVLARKRTRYHRPYLAFVRREVFYLLGADDFNPEFD